MEKLADLFTAKDRNGNDYLVSRIDNTVWSITSLETITRSLTMLNIFFISRNGLAPRRKKSGLTGDGVKKLWQHKPGG